MEGIKTELSGLFSRAKDERELKRVLAHFCDVTPEQIQRWRSGNARPFGVTVLRLRVFLTLAGQPVREFESLSDQARRFAYLIAFGILKLQEAAQRINVHSDTVLTYISGAVRANKREMEIAKLAHDHAQALTDKLEYWKNEIAALKLREKPAPPKESAKSNAGQGEPALVDAVTHSVKTLYALLPLALANLDSEGKKRLRTAIGHTTISDVRTQLQQLNLSDAEYAVEPNLRRNGS